MEVGGRGGAVGPHPAKTRPDASRAQIPRRPRLKMSSSRCTPPSSLEPGDPPEAGSPSIPHRHAGRRSSLPESVALRVRVGRLLAGGRTRAAGNRLFETIRTTDRSGRSLMDMACHRPNGRCREPAPWLASRNPPDGKNRPTLAASSFPARRMASRELSALQKILARAQGGLAPHLTAFFTSAPILASSAAVSAFNAKAVGHRAPSSRFAVSLKPSVAYLVLNFCAPWKKQTTLPSLA